jgi:hypothetical protein
LTIDIGEERYFLIYSTYEEACHTSTGETAMNAAMAPDTDIPGSNSNIVFVHIFIFDHIKAEKIIFIEGSTVYVADKALTFFTKVLKLGAGFRFRALDIELLKDVTSIIAYGNNAILVSSVGGIWKIILDDDDFYYMYNINSTVPKRSITDVNYSVSLTFGYLYVYTFCRITGSGNRDRTTDGAVIEYETGTGKNVALEKDYGEVYFATEIGEDLANYHVIGLSEPFVPRACTHFGLYRTKNIGPAGSAPTAAAVGNRRDQMVWVADVPLLKAFIIDTRTSGHAIILSGN